MTMDESLGLNIKGNVETGEITLAFGGQGGRAERYEITLDQEHASYLAEQLMTAVAHLRSKGR